MARSKLSSFFRSSLKLSKKATSLISSSSSQTSSAKPAQIIKQLKSVISTGTSSEKSTFLDMDLSKYFKPVKPPAATEKSFLKQTGDVTVSSLKMDVGKDSGKTKFQVIFLFVRVVSVKCFFWFAFVCYSDSSPQSVMRNQITDVLSGNCSMKYLNGSCETFYVHFMDYLIWGSKNVAYFHVSERNRCLFSICRQ